MRAPDTTLPIVFEHAAVRAGTVQLLDDVSLTLGAGAPTVIIGPNGAGKTTLLRLAMGLLQPSSGRLTWGGRADAPLRGRAIVFQRPVMLRRTAAGNVRYALAHAGAARSEIVERTGELLARVGLQHLAERPARRLSGGEQQRLGIARALARDPSVLFLDEPTASLDPAASRSIEDLVGEITVRGIKVVMSTHDLGQAKRIAGDVVLLHRGRVVETADARQFFTAPRTPQARRFIDGELLLDA